MKILLTGASGQLGSQLHRDLEGAGKEVVIPNSKGLDVADSQAVSDWIEAYLPETIIHCAAYTKVDQAEGEGRTCCHLVNVKGTRNLAQVGSDHGCLMIYVSTDYVFDGKKGQPYVESDEGHPLSIYGQTKLWGERHVQEFCGRHYIVRTAGLFGQPPNGGENFVTKIIKQAEEGEVIKVVNDQVFSPTSTADLSQVIIGLLEHRPKYGTVYHFSGFGECTWFDFAAEILGLTGLKAELVPISAAELGRPAPRPAYSYLDKAKIGRDVWQPRSWQEMLAEYITANKC